jgi:hypothetical protein
MQSIRLALIGIGLTALMITSFVAAGCEVSTSRTSRVEQHTTPHVAGAPLIVNSRNGQVQIIGEAGRTDVAIEATLTTAGRTLSDAKQRLGQVRLSIVRDTSGKLTVEPIFPEPHHGRDGASFIVRLPDAADVQITTSNAAVTAQGLTAPLTVQTSNGRMTLSDWTGDATLTTSNGRVNVTSHQGRLSVQTSNGRVEIDDHGGPVKAHTSNNRIILTLRPDQIGPIDLRTSNASVDVTVGPAFIGQASLRTSNGSITLTDNASIATSRDTSRNRGAITFGGLNEPASRVRTSNGRIRFTTRGDG